MNNSAQNRVVVGFVVWAAVVSALFIPLEGKTALLWSAWGALLLAGLLAACTVWKFTEERRNEYLTNWMFLAFLTPSLLVSVVVSLTIGALAYYGVWTMDLLWFWAVQVVLLGWLAVRLLLAGAAQEFILNDEAKVAQDTNGWKKLRLQAENILAEAPVASQNSLRKLVELIRYSDPVTILEVAQVEEGIAEKLSVLKYLLSEGDQAKIEAQCAQIETAVKERNARLQAHKK